MYRNLSIVTIALIFVLSAPILLGAPTNITLNEKSASDGIADIVSASVLIDESHAANGSALMVPGNLSLFGWILQENGHTADTNLNELLDSGILSGYDVLVLFYPRTNFTSGEMTAIQNFVSAGGGLLLVGADNENWWSLRPTYLNPFSSPYGIEFNSDRVIDDATVFASHHINYLVTTLGMRAGDMDACTLNVTGSAVSIAQVPSGTVVAATQAGAGRIVAVGSPGPFYQYRKLEPTKSAAHFQFSLNVIDWLVGNDQRAVIEPEIAVIRALPGPQLGTEEIESYEVFVGLYHEHTTHSDGGESPAIMLEKGLNIGLDFMILTDHSHLNPNPVEGINGALAARAIAQTYALDCEQIIGAELSSVKHTTAFPLVENIWTTNQADAVSLTHAQGGIATLAHPTIDYLYAQLYSQMGDYGYDAFEVDNTGFLYGSGEGGLIWPFLGASDSHSVDGVGYVLNAVFVDSPSGPDGRITGDDIKEAVLDRRIVVLDKMNNMVYGDAIWVDRFLALWDQAEQHVVDAQTLLGDLETQGLNITMSLAYLDAAEAALGSWNPYRAMRLVANATSELVLGLDLRVDAPTLGQPSTDSEAIISLYNNHTYSVSLNTTVYALGSVSLDPVNSVLNTSAKSADSIVRALHTESYGYLTFWVNVLGLDTPGYLSPVFILNAGIIDNLTHVVTEKETGYDVEVRFWIGRDNTESVASAMLHYSVGEGWSQIRLSQAWNYFYKKIGTFQPGATLQYYVVVQSSVGEFTLAQRELILPGGVTTTTTTTTTTATTTTTESTTTTITATAMDYTPLLLGAGGLAAAIVVIIVVLRMRKPSA